MWQRIQTLYLSLAIVLNASIFGLELAKLQLADVTHSFMINGMGELYSTVIISVVAGASILVSLLVIMMFKKRQKQIKLSQLNLLVQVALVAAIFFLVDEAAKSLGQTEGLIIVYSAGTYLALLPLVFIYMAIRSIKKDEALVRAADRIR